MKITLDIFGAILGFAAIGSAISKLLKVPDVITAMTSVGVKLNQIPQLAALEIAGGLGLIVGIWSKPLGVLSAICLALYFLGAFSAHLRKKHGVAEFGTPLGLFIIAIVTSVLELKR